ncbi:MAG: DUF3667 domain-containing protein [Planctomycetota bacterium]
MDPTSADRIELPEGRSCANCGAALVGPWCHACGQRVVRDDERRFGALLREFLGRLTSFEAKLPRSVLTLVFRPGRLGVEWIRGSRVRWTTPIGLFLVVNLLYFLNPPVTDFHLPLRDQLKSGGYGAWAQARVEERAPGTRAWVEGSAPVPDGLAAFEDRYDGKSRALSKTLLVLHVPPFALALLLLHRRRRLFYVDHLVHALHFWTFLLLALMAVPALSIAVNRGLLGAGWIERLDAGEALWKLGLIALLVAYLVALVRRAYDEPWRLALPKAALAFLAAALIHFAYRALLFEVTLRAV